MPKLIPKEEKRVKLNCFVAPDTMTWLRTAGLSQGEAVDYAVATAKAAEAEGRVAPTKKQSRAAREIAARSASDLTAKVAERDDIDYADVESGPSTHVAVLDAVSPSVGRTPLFGKVSVADWRAGRKPIPKPGGKN